MTTPVIYTTTASLPMSRFIDCYVDNNLKALIISGEPSDYQLESAWSDIMLEYNDDISDSEAKMHLQVAKGYHILKAVVKEIEVNIQLLSLRFKQQDAEDLNKLLSTKFVFNPENKKEYNNLLARCKSRSIELNIRLQLKEKQLQVLEEKKDKKGAKPTRKYFIKCIKVLSDHAGRELNPETLTAFEFCDRVKDYGSYIKNK